MGLSSAGRAPCQLIPRILQQIQQLLTLHLPRLRCLKLLKLIKLRLLATTAPKISFCSAHLNMYYILYFHVFSGSEGVGVWWGGFILGGCQSLKWSWMYYMFFHIVLSLSNLSGIMMICPEDYELNVRNWTGTEKRPSKNDGYKSMPQVSGSHLSRLIVQQSDVRQFFVAVLHLLTFKLYQTIILATTQSLLNNHKPVCCCVLQQLRFHGKNFLCFWAHRGRTYPKSTPKMTLANTGLRKPLGLSSFKLLRIMQHVDAVWKFRTSEWCPSTSAWSKSMRHNSHVTRVHRETHHPEAIGFRALKIFSRVDNCALACGVRNGRSGNVCQNWKNVYLLPRVSIYESIEFSSLLFLLLLLLSLRGICQNMSNWAQMCSQRIFSLCRCGIWSYSRPGQGFWQDWEILRVQIEYIYIYTISGKGNESIFGIPTFLIQF